MDATERVITEEIAGYQEDLAMWNNQRDALERQLAQAERHIQAILEKMGRV